MFLVPVSYTHLTVPLFSVNGIWEMLNSSCLCRTASMNITDCLIQTICGLSIRSREKCSISRTCRLMTEMRLSVITPTSHSLQRIIPTVRSISSRRTRINRSLSIWHLSLIHIYILFKDLDGNGKIDNSGDNTAKNPGDRKIIGNNSRRYPYAINAGVGWKGFDLTVFFQGVGKRDLIVGTDGKSNFLAWPHTNTDNPNAAATVLKHHLDYWTPENPNAYYPRLGNQTGVNQGTDGFNRRNQTKYLMDASYIKLKNITLSYSFPSSWLEKTRAISAFKVFFSGEDLWTKHHMYKGMDPEQTMSINDLYPFMKKFSFGINVTRCV